MSWQHYGRSDLLSMTKSLSMAISEMAQKHQNWVKLNQTSYVLVTGNKGLLVTKLSIQVYAEK